MNENGEDAKGENKYSSVENQEHELALSGHTCSPKNSNKSTMVICDGDMWP